MNNEGFHRYMNIISAKNFVTWVKYYVSSQPDLGKETTPTKLCLHINKPQVRPHIRKGVLKCSGNNPNSKATKHYFIIEYLCQTPYVMVTL